MTQNRNVDTTNVAMITGTFAALACFHYHELKQHKEHYLKTRHHSDKIEMAYSLKLAILNDSISVASVATAILLSSDIEDSAVVTIFLSGLCAMSVCGAYLVNYEPSDENLGLLGSDADFAGDN